MDCLWLVSLLFGVERRGGVVPRWVKYDRWQARAVESPGALEDVFDRDWGFGPVIPDNYGVLFEACMRRFERWADRAAQNLEYWRKTEGDSRGDEYALFDDVKLRCCVVAFSVAVLRDPDSLCLYWVSVRPCAERLGIFHAIVRAMCARCHALGLAFVVDTPLPRTEALLRKAARCELLGNGRLFECVFPPLLPPAPAVWPEARVLNDQELSDARYKR